MNKQLIFIFITLKIFFYHSIKSTEHFIKGDLIKYPDYTTKTTCSFSFNIVLTNIEQYIANIPQTSFNFESFFLSNDSKTALISITKTDAQFGDTILPLSLYNSSNLIFYSFNLTCSCNIPLSSGYSINNLFFVIKIVNFPKDVHLEGNSMGTTLGSKYLGDNNYHLQINKINSLTSPVKTTLNFANGETLSFMIDLPFQTRTYTEIKSLEYFPNNNISSKDYLIGYGDLKLKTNSSNLLITTDWGNPTIKIGGNNIDEVQYLIPFRGSSLITFSFKIQSGSSFIDKNINFDMGSVHNKMVVVNKGFYVDKTEYISLENVEIKNISLIDSIDILSPPFIYRRKQLSFPFGFVGGNSRQSFFSLSFILYQTNIIYPFSISFSDINIGPFQISGSTDGIAPKLLGYGISISNYNTILFKLRVTDDQSGIKSIQTSSYDCVMLSECILLGDSLDAYLEFRFPFEEDATSIIICDNANNCNTFKFGVHLFLELPNTPIYLTPPKELFSIPKEFDISNCIMDITFKYNDLIVTDKSIANVMYLDIINFPFDRDFTLNILPNSQDSFSVLPAYVSKFNGATKKFECEFIVPANINTGPIQYILTFNSFTIFSFSLPNRFQLNVKESLYIDFIGPIATKVSKYQYGKPHQLGWQFSFEDDINGFKEGYLLVRSSIDMVVRNITGVLTSGTIFNGTYDFGFLISYTCISQTYSIFYAKFIDTQGQETIYDKMTSEMLMNPFYRLLNNDEDFKDISLVCNSSVLSPSGTLEIPSLIDFSVSPTVVEVYSIDRKVTFIYTAYHSDGLLDSIYPTIYLTSLNQEFITGVQSTTMTPINSTFTKYITIIEIPIGFGYPGEIIINCYGFISNAGTHSGFSATLLKDSGFSYKIIPVVNIKNILLTGSSELSSNGGKLIVYGRFLSSIETITVQYQNKEEIYIPTYLYHTQFLIDGISATDNFITITAKSSAGVSSSSLIVYPKLYENSTLLKPSNPSTPTPTQTETKKCKTSCGESKKQGYCSEKQGICICNSPWIGTDCQSQIIVVPPPKVNETNPSTEITSPGTSSEIKYSSIVSIVSLREIDFNNNIVNNYTFDKWIFKSIADTENKKIYSYFSNITMNNQVVSNITSTLEWNSKASVIQFAGQDISLNPSSIKYTISVSKYNFLSQLNTLQLIMSASIQTQNGQSNHECSSKLFGDSSSSPNQNIIDSNYMQLQVNDHSFYGRFIKRCILDSKIVSISNSKLDENLSELNSNKISSFIGINIPWFSNEAIIDPDFSVLISHSDNSCYGIDSNSGLTKSQLIGIIVGSVCFFIVILIIVFYILLKHCLFFKIFIYKLFKKRKY
ncbi:hypothetical protein ACTFIV_007688 [Dictyostelium citrinum]